MPRAKRLTKEQLSQEADLQLRGNAREMLKKWFVAVNGQIEKGDNRTIEMVGRMFQFDKGPGGITIFNQHLQVNQAHADAGVTGKELRSNHRKTRGTGCDPAPTRRSAGKFRR